MSSPAAVASCRCRDGVRGSSESVAASIRGTGKIRTTAPTLRLTVSSVVLDAVKLSDGDPSERVRRETVTESVNVYPMENVCEPADRDGVGVGGGVMVRDTDPETLVEGVGVGGGVIVIEMETSDEFERVKLFGEADSDIDSESGGDGVAAVAVFV